jgi:hypothetical protein
VDECPGQYRRGSGVRSNNKIAIGMSSVYKPVTTGMPAILAYPSA